MMSLLTVIVVVLGLIYMIYSFIFITTWNKTLDQTDDLLPPETYPFVSVVIPARNEAENLPQLLESLEQISYPQDKWEIIVVDDNSTDSTTSIAEEFTHRVPTLKVISASKNSQGKKDVQAHGIALSKGDLILCTDADVVLPSDWIKSMVSYLVRGNLQFLAGPVKLVADYNQFLEHFQSIEFSGMMLMTTSGMKTNLLISANGANMLFTRQAYNDFQKEQTWSDWASGDDVFFAQYLHRKNPKSVDFLVSKKAVVTTPVVKEWDAFIDQRLRWAGKSKAYPHKPTQFFLVVQALIFFLLLGLIVAGHFGLAMLLALPKFVMDYLLLRKSTDYFEIPFGIGSYVKSLLFQAYYTIVVVIRSVLSREYQWKGRTQR